MCRQKIEGKCIGNEPWLVIVPHWGIVQNDDNSPVKYTLWIRNHNLQTYTVSLNSIDNPWWLYGCEDVSSMSWPEVLAGHKSWYPLDFSMGLLPTQEEYVRFRRFFYFVHARTSSYIFGSEIVYQPLNKAIETYLHWHPSRLCIR